MRATKIVLPWPPSVNHYWRMFRGQMVISPEGRKYRSRVVRAVGGRGVNYSGRLRVAISAVPPDRRARDLDNVQKALLDALAHAQVYEDDRQIDDLHIWRNPAVPPGCVKVLIEEVSRNRTLF